MDEHVRPFQEARGRVEWALVVALLLPVVLAGVLLPHRSGEVSDRTPEAPARAVEPPPADLVPPPTGATRRGTELAASPSASETRRAQRFGEESSTRLQLTLIDAGTGARLPGAFVELSRDGVVATHRAGDGGVLHLKLDPGELIAVAWNETLVGGPLSVTLERGALAKSELAMVPGAAVEGRVVDGRDGRPIPGATVAFWTFAETDMVRTEADGTFRHPRFPRDDAAHQVRVAAAGYGPCVRYLEVNGDGSWTHVAAHGGETDQTGAAGPARVDVVLFPEAVITGRVLDDSGRPVEHAHVTAEGYARVLPSVATRDATEARTDAEGHFELRGLRGDVGHAVAVRAAGYSQLVREVASLNNKPGFPSPTSKQEDLGLLRLSPAGHLSGVVLDPAGDPVRDAAVRLVRSDVEPPAGLSPADPGQRAQVWRRDVRTDAGGVFVFDELWAGEFELTVRRDRGALIRERIVLAESEAKGGLRLALSDDSWTLRGQVRSPSGPVAGAEIELNRFGRVGRVRTDARGAFRISGLDDAATYTVSVRHGTFVGVETHSWAWESPLLQVEPAKAVTTPASRPISYK